MFNLTQFIQIYGLFVIAFSYILVLNSNKHENNLIDLSNVCVTFELPKYYATINQGKSEEELDYRQLKIHFGNASDYDFQTYIGKGASGHAYLGMQRSTKNKVVIKTFKTMKWKSIKREINFMQIVQGHELISPLVDIISINNSVSLVYNRFVVFPTSQLMRTMTDNGNKLFLYQTLKALDYVHSKGVIHGDIKPANIITNPNTKLFKLIDWGLSMYYVPGRPKNPSVGTKQFAVIEKDHTNRQKSFLDTNILIIRLTFMLSDLCSHRWFLKIIVPSKWQSDLERKKLLTFTELLVCLEQKAQKKQLKNLMLNLISKIFLSNEPINHSYEAVNLNKFINSNNSQYCTSDAIDLFLKMMQYDAKKRITPKDALKHPYFDSIRGQFE